MCTFPTVPSAPIVRINPFNGDVTAGGTLRVTCSLILQEGIMYNDDTLTTQWSRDGTPLPAGESSGALIFISPVNTSHAGRYTCTARLNIPEAGVDISGTNTTSIVVQSMLKDLLSYKLCMYVLFSSPSNIDHHWISKR